MLETGIKGIQSKKVMAEDTAEYRLSGLLPVYATPALIAFIEYTCFRSVDYKLEPGKGTVGTLVNIKHLCASPVGSTVTCMSELTEIDGRRLVFKVEIHDDYDLIAEGTHERFIINNEHFMDKVNNKAERLNDLSKQG